MNAGAPNITTLLQQAAANSPGATDSLFPVVYDELRRMARAQMAQERSAQTLQPTALVHEAYMRLVGSEDVRWDSRGHFFAAAAIAMRRILVERARARASQKRGGNRQRVALGDDALTAEPEHETMLAIDDLLEKLEAYDAAKARIVMLRFFAGLTIEETAAAMNLTPAQVKSEWTFARAWMHNQMKPDAPGDPGASA